MGIPTLGGFSGMAPMALDAAAVSSGMAFLVGELEKRDPRLMEPLLSVTWMRDIVSKTGGGYVEFTSNYFVDYATAGANQYGIIGGETNNIPIIQANLSKDVFKVFTFANNIKVPFLDQQRMNQVGRSLDQIFDDGLRINYNKALDQNVYFGYSDFGTTGLVNDPNLAATAAALNAAGTSRAWVDKTPTEIMADVNTGLVAAWAASEYDITGMPNHILIPPAQFAYINTTLVSIAGSESILSYIKRNNIANAQGVNLEILPARQCIGAGSSVESGVATSDRMVMYRNSDDRVCFDLPVPLTRAMTQPDVNQMAYLTGYIGLIGQVKFLYTQCARYVDGI